MSTESSGDIAMLVFLGIVVAGTLIFLAVTCAALFGVLLATAVSAGPCP